MKRKALYGSLACIALFICFRSVTIVDARKKEFSSTTHVSIDGKSFLEDVSFSNESTLLRRELARAGFMVPETMDIPEESRARNPLFSGNLVEAANPPIIGTPKAPPGLTADHTLRMSGDHQTVDLVFGKIGSRGPSVRADLATKGWIPATLEGKSPAPAILQRVQGKETSVVCLDETEGTFLLIRKLER